MKSVGAIKHKLNQVRFRHLKRRLEAELRPASGNCLHNTTLLRHQALSSKGVHGDKAGVGICVVGVQDMDPAWPVSYCDDQIDEGVRSRTCEKFCPRRTKDEIKADFQQRLESMTLPEVAFHYPDMAALIWVLDADDLGLSDDDSSSEPTPFPQETSPPVIAPVTSSLVENPSFVQSEPNPDLEAPKKPWYARLLGVL